MFKKIALVFGLSLSASGAAFATCTDPLPINNNVPATVNMSVANNTADGGCMSNVVPNQGGAPLSTINPLPTSVNDGTNGPMAVKAASTAPAATDKAGVVALSPNTGEVGTPGTGITQPSGGVGLSGWLSGVYKTLLSFLGTAGSPATQVASVQGVSGGTPVPTSLSSVPSATATGNITSTQTVAINPSGQSTVGIQVTGTWTGTLAVEVSVDGTNYIATTTIPVLSGSVQSANITANGIYQSNAAGFVSFRIRGNTVATGTAVVTLLGAFGNATIMADNPVPVTGYAGMTAVQVAAAAAAFANGASVAQGSTTDTPCTLPATATACSQVAIEKALANAANSPVPIGSASGGWTRTLFAGITNSVQTVKASAGQVGKLYCDNPNATAIYVELFDVSGTVTLGTTAPTQAYYIPATNAAGFSLPLVGDQYANAIKIAAVTTENGSTAPGTPGNCNVSWN